MISKKAALTTLTGLIISSGAHAEVLWQDFSLSYLNGKNYQVGDDNRQVLTVEHASGHSWGDNFFFMDRLRSQNGGNETYFELSPRLSFGKLSGKDLSFGPVQDVLLASTWEGGEEFNNYMLGLGFAFDIPGFRYANINFYKVNNEKTDDDAMLTVTWGYPFALGNVDFLYDGFIDWSTAQDDHASEMNFTSQLKMNIGKYMGLKSPLYIGMEYAYWNNKFGIQDVDERNPALLVKYHF